MELDMNKIKRLKRSQSKERLCSYAIGDLGEEASKTVKSNFKR